ncbi:MAG TPA: ribosomal protein S18-alanine N-acetyltransferase [Myxococcota bacterium]|nr:ribosomal protein S18-alanine N-acetyltransferase [Myxococcota bacterium]HPC92851.1 ribosomal protein S18-alanine N-acetyltransferase [Myxococcota bacterium]HRR75086.1 ribosomal protein S18-alanine N-acetyltransferase [Myxococcota bacterium]HRV18625.1 ribosomal protein S18-alanine N-acetyltransferase [Myxococcota bacterium]
MTNQFKFSDLAEADLADISELESKCFADPWPAKAFEDEINNELSRSILIRTKEGELVAYCIFWIVGPEAHLLSIAVSPTHRRLGIAKTLMLKMFEMAILELAEYVVLEVRKSNEAAKTLYRILGFQTIGFRRRYYQNGEDAEVMMLQIA